ncbi:hypothetical protein R3P38DRAFT_3540853, partial [Favolaschia claudopus]
VEIAEAQYYFRTKTGIALALLLLYPRPNQALLIRSHYTVWSCNFADERKFAVTNVKAIQTVVAMIPFKPDGRDAWFLLLDTHWGT